MCRPDATKITDVVKTCMMDSRDLRIWLRLDYLEAARESEMRIQDETKIASRQWENQKHHYRELVLGCEFCLAWIADPVREIR